MPVTRSPKSIIRKNSTGSDFERRRINIIEGTNISLTVSDDPTNNETDITIAASGGSSITGTDKQVVFFDGDDNPAGDADFTWDKTTNTLGLAAPTGRTLEVTTVQNSNWDNETALLINDPASTNFNGTGETTFIISGASIGLVYNAVINNAGSGYTSNDVLTVSGGDGTATLIVGTVNGGGAITSLTVTPPHGSGYVTSTNVALSGGTGTGATADITANPSGYWRGFMFSSLGGGAPGSQIAEISPGDSDGNFIGTIILQSGNGNTAFYLSNDGSNDYMEFRNGNGGPFKFQNGGAYGILDFTSLSSTDKTFTFPNQTGTIALTSDIPAAGANTALSNLSSVAINTALLLGTSDAAALGSATKMWSDLFLASGAVINFNNGDVTITHASDKITVAGGDLEVPDEAYDATAWNGSLEVPTKNAIRDKIESLSLSGGVDTANSPNANEFARFTDADTIEGRTAAETRADLDLEAGTDFYSIAATDSAIATHAALTATHGATGAVVGTTNTQTLTNKRITKRVVTAADATSITPNTDNADITYQANTQSVGTLTINADAGTPTNGQSWLLKIKSTNVQTFSWNSMFVGGTTALPTASTGSSKIDYYSFIYDTVNSKWQYTGSALGF